MKRITPIEIEFSSYSGFYLELLGLGHENWDEDRSLFSFNVGPKFMYISLLFINLRIYDRTNNNSKCIPQYCE